MDTLAMQPLRLPKSPSSTAANLPLHIPDLHIYAAISPEAHSPLASPRAPRRSPTLSPRVAGASTYMQLRTPPGSTTPRRKTYYTEPTTPPPSERVAGRHAHGAPVPDMKMLGCVDRGALKSTSAKSIIYAHTEESP